MVDSAWPDQAMGHEYVGIVERVGPADAGPGKTVAVVVDGAVGLLGVLGSPI